jgi:SAM-dependent methyltransferase
MDFLLSNPASSRLHSNNFLELLYQFPEMMESIDNVLDLGCGRGYDSLWWATIDDADPDNPQPLNINVTALDKENTLDEDIEHKNIKFIQQDWDTVDLDETYDVVWAHNILHEAKDPLKLLHQVNRLTAEGGMLCLSFPTTVNTFYGDPDHRVYDKAPHSITMPGLIYMLALSGFNCNEGFFLKQPNTNIINAVVYKETDNVYYYGEKVLYDLVDLLPESCNAQLNRFGYITNKGLLLHWIDGSLVDYSNF